MVSSYELHLLAERKSPKTVRTYVEAAQWIAGALLLAAGVTDWAQVTARHVQQWMVTLLGKGSAGCGSATTPRGRSTGTCASGPAMRRPARRGHGSGSATAAR